MNLADTYLRNASPWPDLTALMQTRVARHGDSARWHQALTTLTAELPEPAGPVRAVGAIGTLGELADASAIRRALVALSPWRKGPWAIADLTIDTEWRSDWKWQRLAPHLPPVEGQRVLDVGSGNGYYGWHWLRAGAAEVTGIDPTVLFLFQHLAMRHCLGPAANHVLPLRDDELPPPDVPYDLVCSMGVLYHRRDPLQHIDALLAQLRPGGTLVLETLVNRTGDLRPEGRYARMRNVHLVPAPATVSRWLAQRGLAPSDACDLTATRPEEQRSTPWMTFQSLTDALDASDPQRTIEGHPAPVRACFVAQFRP